MICCRGCSDGPCKRLSLLALVHSTSRLGVSTEYANVLFFIRLPVVLVIGALVVLPLSLNLLFDAINPFAWWPVFGILVLF